jgi:type I restriction enzyme R subunit
MIAVVEAKASYKKAGDGLQQAKNYARTLGLNFAYATNGKEIIEYDFSSGRETTIENFPSPIQLWERLRVFEGMQDPLMAERILTPNYTVVGKPSRYYQEIAINKVMKAILSGQKRILLTMATGTGKTFVAFQIAWKLWNTRWNMTREYRKPRILYLADRNVLVDDPKDKIFAPFGDARNKIQGEAIKGREIYFATYQSIASDKRRPGLYREFPQDFFDLIIIDECHRGSAHDESNWREILQYFSPSYQLGMTATPLREDNKITYRYFGNPVYTYSLRDGIQDGFLAPYRVRRIISSVDAEGWRPTKEQIDRYGRAIPDRIYETSDFERTISLKTRTQAVARHLTDYLKENDRWAKTIVYCVDQEHADEMRRELNNLNSDLSKASDDYVVRIVSDEGEIGRGFLDKYMDIETKTPVLVTTSQLLTTGVDIPLCKNIVLFRVINSMTEFKQIIGRGTRVNDDYGKLFFTILDYTGSATRLFADPDFDGDPAILTQEEMNVDGVRTKTITLRGFEDLKDGSISISNDSEGEVKKYFVDGGIVQITADIVFDLDKDGHKIRAISYTEYVGREVRSMFTSAAEMKSKWTTAQQRNALIESLQERGISLEQLTLSSRMLDSDPFDILISVAFSTPVRTRRERAERIRRMGKNFFDKFRPEAQSILSEVLDKYVEFGASQFDNVNVLKIEPISRHGNLLEIAEFFGGTEVLLASLQEMQNRLYEE